MARFDSIHINTKGVLSVHIRHRDSRHQPSFVCYNPTAASLNRLRRLAAYYYNIILI